MIEIKQQQDIEKHFTNKVLDLVKSFKIRTDEWDNNQSNEKFLFDFKVVSSSLNVVLDQKISIGKETWVENKKTIENNNFVKQYEMPKKVEKIKVIKKKKTR